MPENSDKIQNHIRQLRFQNRQMTQQQLADKVGVTRQTINAIEAEKYLPTYEELKVKQ